jgi:hypothetical protein
VRIALLGSVTGTAVDVVDGGNFKRPFIANPRRLAVAGAKTQAV